MLRIAVVAAAFSVIVVGQAYEETHTDVIFEQLAELRSSLLVSRAAAPATLVPPLTENAPGIASAPPGADAVSEPAQPMADRSATRQPSPSPISMPLSAPAPVPAAEPASGPAVDEARIPADSPGNPAADDHARATGSIEQPEVAASRSFRSMDSGELQTPPSAGDGD